MIVLFCDWDSPLDGITVFKEGRQERLSAELLLYKLSKNKNTAVLVRVHLSNGKFD